MRNLVMRLGIAHHYGWANAVVASLDHRVVDRRRIELITGDLPAAPIHHEGGTHGLHQAGQPLDDEALRRLVQKVRAAVAQACESALDEIELAVGDHITTISVRSWPQDFPDDVSVLRHAPFESRADSVMYCQILAQVAIDRGWDVHTFDARTVEHQAATILGDRAREVLHGPRIRLGPPWAKDQRIALAATIVAA